jgi:MoxR-like ATPase
MENQNNEEVNLNTPHQLDLAPFANAVFQIRNEVGKLLVGQQSMVDLMIAALFSNGHVLIEGVPGIAKTMAAKLLAKSLDLDFSRIQFTPDLMPADVTGTGIFNLKTNEFEFRKGPIFANIVLIDEINRSPAKTQAAMFEVMEEGQVTSDGFSHLLPQPFMVIATQNPIEQEGTYKLPEAQQDRFMMKILVDYPTHEQETEILRRFNSSSNSASFEKINAVMSASDIKVIRDLIDRVFVQDSLLNYISGVVGATRNHRDLYLGASPRAALAIMRLSKVIAAMNGRSFVTPDDIRYVTFPVLNHRLILTPESEMEGVEMKQVVEEILKTVEVPR